MSTLSGVIVSGVSADNRGDKNRICALVADRFDVFLIQIILERTAGGRRTVRIGVTSKFCALIVVTKADHNIISGLNALHQLLILTHINVTLGACAGNGKVLNVDALDVET